MKIVHLFIPQFFGFDETLMKGEHDYGALQTSSSRKWERQVIFQENVLKKQKWELVIIAPYSTDWFDLVRNRHETSKCSRCNNY